MRLAHVLFILAAVAAIASGCTKAGSFIECQDNGSCDRFAGGQCFENQDTGNQFCTYPDDECPSGTRWSDLDVEDGISGECVGNETIIPDAGVDGPPPPDATPGSPMILGIELPTRVGPGSPTIVNCMATDPDGDALTYTWTFSAGSYTGTDDIVTWTPPATEQVVMVTCEVSDGGLMDSLTVSSTALVTNGLVAGYFFNGDGADFSGNGHTVTIPGGMSFVNDRFGTAGGALRFNGVNNFLTVPTESDFDFTEFTVISFFDLTASNTHRDLVGKGTNTSGGAFTIRVQEDDAASLAGTGRIMYAAAGGGSFSNFTAAALSNTQFINLATKRTATDVRLYVGGALSSAISHGGDLGVMTNDPVTIGKGGTSTAFYFYGDVDDLRIYNRSLTDLEITAIVNGTVAN